MKYWYSLLVLQPVLAAHCPPTGALLPPPSLASLPNSAGLHDKLNALLTSKTTSWNTSTNSFSVTLTSANDTIFEHHYTAPVRGEGGVASVDSDTTYRIMSITKVFNTLTLMLHAPYSLDTPITKYIPELQGSKEYADVTLRMLTDQSAGVPRDGRHKFLSFAQILTKKRLCLGPLQRTRTTVDRSRLPHSRQQEHPVM